MLAAKGDSADELYGRRITVVIAVYNSDFYKLALTILSVVEQKGVKAGIVIADDGSGEDLTAPVDMLFRRLGFANYTYLRRGSNVGIVTNVYEACGHVGTDYVKLLSPGDLLYRDVTLLNYIKAMEVSGAAFSFGRPLYYSNDDELQIYDKTLPVLPQPYVESDWRTAKRHCVRYGSGVHGASIVYDTQELVSALERMNGRVRYCEDLSMRLMLATGRRCTFLDEYVVWYEYGTGVSTDAGRREWWRRAETQDLDAIHALLRESAGDDADVRAAVLDRRLARVPVAASLMRAVADPGRAAFVLRKRLAQARYRAEDYDVAPLLATVGEARRLCTSIGYGEEGDTCR